MLDLSFLTKEEYEKLMKVLQRDEELKKKDDDRIRRLQGSLKDEKKKKFVTGEWFLEVKAQRFQQELEGPELLRASIIKKSLSEEKNAVCAPENLEKGDASLPLEGTAVPSPTSEEERSWELAVDSTKEPRASPKPRLKLSTLPSLTNKRSSLEDISPADSGLGVSPFLPTREDSQTHGKDTAVSSEASTILWGRNLEDIPYSSGMDVPDGTNHLSENQAIQPTLHEEINTSSRIPVKIKSSKGLFSPGTDHGNRGENPQVDLMKRESLKTSRPSSPRGENGRFVKQGPNYTISPISHEDEEVVLDREHFKNLKNFWERNGESVLANDGSKQLAEKEVYVESNGRPSKLNRSLSVQSNQSQNSDDKLSHTQPKSRVPYRRPSVLSSSEDEPSYVVHPRKGSGPSLPRSTYARSKGGMAHRNSLNEGNARQSSVVEEEKKTQRCTRRSKLPIRVPSVKIETPANEGKGTLFEPETPADEFVMAEESTRKRDSLAGRVQILIESAPSEDTEKGGSEVEGSCELNTPGHLESKETLVEEELPPSTEDLPGDGASGYQGVGQEVDSSAIPERPGLHPPMAKKLTRTNGYSLAKSMVNLYTTTETYTKPQMSTHQYLEPERAKDLSKSSPLLLSETESDTASEISFQFHRHKKSPSMGSHSSGMASVSSVSGSVLSVYSGDFGSVDTQGHVQFALDYDEKNREFQIFVSQCKDLAIVDEKKARTDPYVKTYLLPDKARMGKRKTSVKKRTVSPVYNEVLRYKIEKMVLLIQKLNLSVWHNDPLGRNSFLGEMEIDLAGWDWRNNKLNWYILKPRSLSANNCVGHRGVMNLAIKYVPPGSLGWKTPPSGEVHIWVKDTKDLPQLRPSGVDSFVKCYILPDTSKKSYQKTRIIKRDSNPIFNHTIVYDGFHTEDLKDACVELTVWDHEKLANHFLGGIRLGLGTGSSYGITVDWMDSTQEEVAFWQEMMATVNEWIEGSLPLRSLAGRKKLK